MCTSRKYETVIQIIGFVHPLNYAIALRVHSRKLTIT